MSVVILRAIVCVINPSVFRDMSLRWGSVENWHHLNLPVLIDNTQPYSAQYPENTNAIPVEHGLPDGWLWDGDDAIRL